MHIVLLILKILGIALLAVLGIILLLLLLVLFVPVRYTAEGSIRAGGHPEITGKVHYLLHILSIRFSYTERGPSYTAKIFGIPLKPGRKRKKNYKANEAEDGCEPDDPEEITENREPAAADDLSAADGLQEPGDIAEKNGENKKNRGHRRKPLYQELQDKKKRLFSKVRGIIQKIKSIIVKIVEAIRNVKEKYGKLKGIITDEANKRVIKKAFRELKYLFLHFKFRKIYTSLTFSLGDPARTGQTLGALCLLPVMYRHDIHIFPDFEAEEGYAEGEFRISGHIRLIHLLRTALRLLFDKECRRFVKLFLEQ